MEIKHFKGTAGQAAGEVLVVPIFEDDNVARAPLKEIDDALEGLLGPALKHGEVSAKPCSMWTWPGGALEAPRVMLIGAGSKKAATDDVMRRVYGTAARAIRGTFLSAAILLRNDAHAQAAVDGFVTGDFEPDLYRAKRNTSKLEVLVVVSNSDVKKAVEAGRIIGEATNFCRTMVTMTPNDLTPTKLAKIATDELKPLGVEVSVLKGKQLDGFGGLKGVAQGSTEPPMFITMAWEPTKARKNPVLGLVGKGVTFDSGGLSLKPNAGMEWMKGDMAGAAAVISAMRAIAELKLPIRVKAVCPATENMPSGTAFRVGDVLTMYSGKTVEVLNTDAEGRLILADGLAWLAEQGVTHMANAATLTGAIVTALGNTTIGIMGRPDRWVDTVLKSARKAGERAWPLPLYDEYREQLKSDIADMKNIGGAPAGSITAGWFLAEFVPEEIPWAHLDIAGVAWGDAKSHRTKGATGAATRAFVQLAQDMSVAKV